MSEEATRVDRRLFIGGSDVAKVCRVAPQRWGNIVDLWKEKTADEPVWMDESESSGKMAAGKALEPAIRQMAMEEIEKNLGHTVVCRDTNVRRAHDLYLYFISECDAVLEIQDQGRYALEIKNTTSYRDWGEPLSDQVPTHYLVQALAQIACHNLDGCVFAVLKSGWRLDLYVIERAEKADLIAEMIQEVESFWTRNVLMCIAPEIKEGHEAIALYRGADDGDILTGTDEMEDLCRAYNKAKAEEAEAKKWKEHWKGELVKLIGTAACAIRDGRELFSYRANKKGVRTLLVSEDRE